MVFVLFWFFSCFVLLCFFLSHRNLSLSSASIGPCLLHPSHSDLPQWAPCTHVGVKRKYMLGVFILCIAIPLSFVFFFLNSLFACTCSSHTLCLSGGGGWTAFPFQGRYTAEDLLARSTRCCWKGNAPFTFLQFCLFTERGVWWGKRGFWPIFNKRRESCKKHPV